MELPRAARKGRQGLGLTFRGHGQDAKPGTYIEAGHTGINGREAISGIPPFGLLGSCHRDSLPDRAPSSPWKKSGPGLDGSRHLLYTA